MFLKIELYILLILITDRYLKNKNLITLWLVVFLTPFSAFSDVYKGSSSRGRLQTKKIIFYAFFNSTYHIMFLPVLLTFLNGTPKKRLNIPISAKIYNLLNKRT